MLIQYSTLMFIYTTWNVQIIKQGKLIYRSEKYRKINQSKNKIWIN